MTMNFLEFIALLLASPNIIFILDMHKEEYVIIYKVFKKQLLNQLKKWVFWGLTYPIKSFYYTLSEHN